MSKEGSHADHKNTILSGFKGAALEIPAAILTQFAQNAKIKMQNTKEDLGFIEAIGKSVKEVGIKDTLFKGTYNAIFKLFGRGVIMYPVLGYIERSIPKQTQEEHPIISSAAKSGLYGMGAAVIGTPLDTSLASSIKEKSSVPSACKKIYQENGVEGFYRAADTDFYKHLLSAMFMFYFRAGQQHISGGKKMTEIETAALSVLTAIAKIAVTQPLDAIKGRQQGGAGEKLLYTNNPFNNTVLRSGYEIFSTGKVLVEEKGLKGLYKGTAPRGITAATGYWISNKVIDWNSGRE
jgi:hypothetical protein